MKSKYPILYLLLFLVMITGTLASMALNGYGMKLMGLGCIGFALTFLHELIMRRERKFIYLIELGILSVLCVLLACRNLFIEVPAGQKITTLLFALLSILYFYYGARAVRKFWNSNRKAALGLLGYYGALVSFLLGFLSGLLSISPDFGTVAGLLFTALIVVTHMTTGVLHVKGENTTLLRLVISTKNKSTVVLLALLVTGFFYTLIAFHALPPLYAGDMPVGYIKLVQQAETGQDPGTTQGKPRHREFRKAYQQFLDRTK